MSAATYLETNSHLQKTNELPAMVTLSHFWSLKLDVRQGNCPLFRNKKLVVSR
jgi:hypothetical protein